MTITGDSRVIVIDLSNCKYIVTACLYSPAFNASLMPPNTHQACYPIAVDLWSSLLSLGNVQARLVIALAFLRSVSAQANKFGVPAAFMVNVIGIKYRLVSWIKLDH